MNNYRGYDPKLLIKKKIFIEDYIKKNPRKKNYYDYLSKNQSEDKENFIKVYTRCIYCGINFDYIPRSNCEIEHVIPKTKDSNLKHDISNLVCSCKNCNRVKGNAILPNNIHPDNSTLNKYFKRDYYFRIKPIDKNSEISKKISDLLKYERRYHQLYFLREYIEDNTKLNENLKNKLLKKLDIVLNSEC